MIQEAVAAMREALQRGDGKHLVVGPDGAGLLTWADVVCALSLQFVQPHASLIAMGEATRRAWTTPEAVDNQVLRWRDAIIEQRPRAR